MGVSRRDFVQAAAAATASPSQSPFGFGSAHPPQAADQWAGVTNVRAFGAIGDGETDDTDAIQAAIEAGVSGIVFFPLGRYVIGGLELPADIRLVGASVSGSYLKVRPGFAGTAVTDRGNGTRIQIEDLVLDCSEQSSGHGIELGFSGTSNNNEHNFLAWLRGVRVFECPGTAFRINANVSELVDVWATAGNLVGMHLEGTVVRGHRVACEGNVERELVLGCTDAELWGLHVETDIEDNPILVDGYGAVFDGITLSIGPDTTVRDVIRLSARTSGCELYGVRINLNQQGADYVNLIRDEAWGVTVARADLYNPRHLGVYRQRGVASYLGDLHGPQAAPPMTLGDGDSSPSVARGTVFRTANTRATSISSFMNGVDGQEITILLDRNTRVVSSGNVRLRGDQPLQGRDFVTLTLVRIDAVWYEKARTAD